jgi:hypothetical protein
MRCSKRGVLIEMPDWLQVVLFFLGAWGSLGLFLWGVLALKDAPKGQE